MPPIAATPSFNEATAIHDGLRRRIKDLQEYQIPRLRTCLGPLPLQQQLATELREDVESFQKQLKVLETLVEDQEKEKDRMKVQDWVEEMSEMIAQIRKDGRGALLSSKRALDLQNRSHRDELLRSTMAATQSVPGNKSATDDALMKANNDVTEALRRTTGLMQQELERSVLTTQMLDESTRTLRSTNDLYSAFGTLLHTSKTLVTALERSDMLDRLLIAASLFLFLSAVLYILKVRVVDKGLWLAFWWIKYLPSRSSTGMPSTTSSLAPAVETVSIGSSLSQVAQVAVTGTFASLIASTSITNEHATQSFPSIPTDEAHDEL